MLAGARIGLGKAFTLVIIFTLIIIVGGYYWIAGELLKTDTRDVYQFKNDLLQDKLSRNPTDIDAKLDLVVSQYLQGKTGDALNTSQSILEQDPENTSALFYMGLIKVDMKDYKSAVPLLEKVLSVNPGLQPRLLYYNLGMAYFQAGNYAKAIETLKVASRVDPGSGPASYYLGMSYLKLGQYQNARIPLQKALSLGENTSETKRALANIDVQLKKQSR